ncbi:MAG: hypothetical protein HOF85_08300 [Acidiferrobacteraceae bacterium]|nr:hypothetical protein [Acidiferrobacteraceae bacterium]
MKRKLRASVLGFKLPLVVLVAVLNPSVATSHSGGLNSSGCHAGSKPYHCHRSPSEMVGNRLRCDLGSKSVECDQTPPREETVKSGSVEVLPYREGSYTGNVSNGLPHGRGTWSHSYFGKYVGDFFNGLMQGAGVHTFLEGGHLVGKWKNGQLDGQGVMLLPGGTKDIGLYRNGEKYHSVILLSDGSVFIGDVQGEDFNGQGVHVFTDGSLIIGEWKSNKPWTTMSYDSLGRLTLQHKNGLPQ